MLTFKKKYFILCILLFIIEVIIALFIDDHIIRPYIGDTLVVILIYCFIKSFFVIDSLYAAFGVLLFSFAIEILQYFNFVEVIGLQHSRLALVIFGNSFAWLDLAAYILGFIVILWIERIPLFNRIRSMF
ncbi:ribosomal maturation YjgA family protein [Aquimarina pacifica]|uniref:ribosomal maturation YjgA family protein n=1 Tax=Aquimarina pacifica TaxID=1296415 RepID=UPI000470AFDC|nr:DUF2809 domain-containing protein [Aquimarina pacifica]